MFLLKHQQNVHQSLLLTITNIAQVSILQGPVSLDSGLLENNAGSCHFKEICCLGLYHFKVLEQSHSEFSSKDIYRAHLTSGNGTEKLASQQQSVMVGLGVDLGDILRSTIKWM